MRDPLETISVVFYIAISSIIILSNGFVILSILTIRTLRTAPNLLIVSLSFADFLAGCIAVPFRLMEIHRLNFTLDVDHCRISHVFTLLNVTASMLNLVTIAIDRYIAIEHPFKYIQIQSKPGTYIATLIITPWTIASIVTFLPLYAWGSNGIHSARDKTIGICKFNETLEKDFVLFILIGIEMISILIIIIINIKIYLVARGHMRRIAPAPAAISSENSDIQLSARRSEATQVRRNSSTHSSRLFAVNAARLPSVQRNSVAPIMPSQNQRTSNSMNSRSSSSNNNMSQLRTFQRQRRHMFLKTWKTTKTMFIIFAIFSFCWLGFIIPTAIFIGCPSCANKTVIMIGTVIMFSASAINPFIFFFRIKSFRIETMAAFRRLYTSS